MCGTVQAVLLIRIRIILGSWFRIRINMMRIRNTGTITKYFSSIQLQSSRLRQ
jgi:hypothetical protein